MKQTNESGYTLVSVLLVFLLFSILGVSLTTMSLSSVKASKTEQNYQSSFYIAEAGLNYKYNEIKSHLESGNIETVDQWDSYIDSQLNVPTYLSFDQEDELILSPTSNGFEVYAEIHVNHLPSESEHVYEIVSTGHQDNQTRTVSQAFNFNYEEIAGGGEYELPPFAVFTSGKVEMSSGGTIEGPIGTTNDATGAVSFPSGGPNFVGDIYVPNGDENIFYKDPEMKKVKATIKPIDPNWKVPELPNFPIFPENFLKIQELMNGFSGWKKGLIIENNNLLIDKEINNNYTLIMDDNMEFNDIIISGNRTLNIDVGDTDKEIVANHLNIPSGHINLIGNGNLTFYVTDKITMAAGSTINNQGDISNINIFLKKSNPAKEITVGGSAEIFGSLYAENANITLGAGARINGNIFSGGEKLIIGGGSTNQTQLFFAPHAEIVFNAGGSLDGRVIGRNVKNSGGAKIIFDNKLDNYITGPISIEAIEEFNKGGSGGSLPFPSGQIDPDSINIDKTGPFREVDHE